MSTQAQLDKATAMGADAGRCYAETGAMPRNPFRGRIDDLAKAWAIAMVDQMPAPQLAATPAS
jgi:hypothetical protein